MKWCPRCNLLYQQGANCARCGGWLYDAPTEVLQPGSEASDRRAEEQRPKRKGAAVAITLLSMACVGMGAALCVALLAPAAPSGEIERYESELGAAREVEQSVLESGYDWAMAIYDRAAAFAQEANSTRSDEQEAIDPSAMTPEDWQEYQDSVEDSLDQAAESLSGLFGLAALGDNEVRSAISAPILKIGEEYPDIAASWNAVLADAGMGGEQTNQDTIADEDLSRYLDAVDAYRQAAQESGFDTSEWGD